MFYIYDTPGYESCWNETNFDILDLPIIFIILLRLGKNSNTKNEISQEKIASNEAGMRAQSIVPNSLRSYGL